jgi:sugar lactone lactonase YvrE
LAGAVTVLAISLGIGLALGTSGGGPTSAPVRHHAPVAPALAPAAPVATAPAVAPKQPGPLAVGPTGSLYMADGALNEVLERLPTGAFAVVAGSGRPGYSGDGGPATLAALDQPQGMAVAADGTLYIADSGNDRVRSVLPDGTITTVAGDGQPVGVGGSPLSGAAATETAIGPVPAVAIGPGGTLYIAAANSVLRLAADGTLETVADAADFLGVDQRFPGSSECDPNGLAFDGSGDLYMTCQNTNDLLEMTPDGAFAYRGILRPHDAVAALAGSPDGSVLGLWQSAVYRFTATGEQELNALSSIPGINFWPTGVAIAPDGTIYVDQDGTGGVGPPAIVEDSPSGSISVAWSAQPN